MKFLTRKLAENSYSDDLGSTPGSKGSPMQNSRTWRGSLRRHFKQYAGSTEAKSTNGIFRYNWRERKKMLMANKKRN